MPTISKLATSKYLTNKHWEARDPSQIKYIIPHHMAGLMTGANCAQYFVNNGLQNSVNYCIGYAGDISCNVYEEYGPWTSSFWGADKYAITIECSDTAAGNWTIPAATQEALIRLMVDIFQRYPSLGGKAIYDTSDASKVASAKANDRNITGVKGNILLHQWTSNYGTTCPEWHMKQILPDIVKAVNQRLAGGATKRTLREEAQYMIDNNINGQARINQAAADGFTAAKVQAEIDLMLGKNTAAAINDLVNVMPVVQSGSKSDSVYYLQRELKRMGYYTGAIDGIAGDATVKSIKAIQSNWKKVYGGFAVDGVFGTACWKRLLSGA